MDRFATRDTRPQPREQRQHVFRDLVCRRALRVGTAARSSVRNDALLVGLLILLGVVAPVVLSVAAGSFDIPRNDDWSYRRTALGLWSTGRLAFDGVAGMMLIGQILLVQPFLWLTGGGAQAFSAAGVMVSGLVILTVYALARQFVSPARSFVVALSLLLFPGYLAYSASFMTDAPAMAAELGALAIGARALSRAQLNVRLLAVAMVIAIIGFSIRQFGLAAVGAIALAAVGRLPRRPSGWAIAVGGLGACLLLQVVRSRLPGELEPLPAQLWFATRLPEAAVTISLMALPAAIIALVTNRRGWRIGDVIVGAAVGVAVVVAVVALWMRLGTFPTALLGNLTTQFGVQGVFDLSSTRPYLFTDGYWMAINLIGLLGTVVVGASVGGTLGTRLRDALAGRRRVIGQARSPVGLIATFVVLYGVGVVLYGSVLIVFDRYVWPLVPALALLLVLPVTPSVRVGIPPEPGWGRIFRPLTLAPLIVTTLSGTMSLILMANAFAFDGARWRAGEDLVAAGLRPDTIDAGFEWMGFHSITPARLAHPAPADPPYRGWWPDATTCGLVTGSPELPQHGRLVGVERYQLYLVTGPRVNLYLYALDSPACPGGKAI